MIDFIISLAPLLLGAFGFIYGNYQKNKAEISNQEAEHFRHLAERSIRNAAIEKNISTFLQSNKHNETIENTVKSAADNRGHFTD